MSKSISPSVIMVAVILTVGVVSLFSYKSMQQQMKSAEVPATVLPKRREDASARPKPSSNSATVPTPDTHAHSSAPLMPGEKPASALARVIAGLDSLETEGDDRLSKEQSARILPLLKAFQTAHIPINDAKCQAALREIAFTLTDRQKKVIRESAKEIALDAKDPLKTAAVRQRLNQLVKRLEQPET